LDEVKTDYDFILIDTPPAIYEFTSNALLASDYALIIMQTETDSFLGALHYYDFVLKMNEAIKQHNKEIEALPSIGIKRLENSKRVQIVEEQNCSNKRTYNREGVILNEYTCFRKYR